jgi:hypothetical protein
MNTLKRRVQHLEGRTGTSAPLPWERPDWEQWSDAELLGELEGYVAAHPASPLARKWRAIAALPDHELEALLVTLQGQLGEMSGVAGPIAPDTVRPAGR